MAECGKFGPLLGVIYVGDVFCKFFVYAAKNAEVLTCHEIKLKQIARQPGWLEFNPNDIWTCVVECIEVACNNLVILDINPRDIISIGICNQRGSLVLWDKETGNPLFNVIAWYDTRSSSTVKNILLNLKGNKNYCKSVCGLPLSNCFSAIKFKWLYENIPSVPESISNKKCYFGTLDTWILWNLTGGVNGGIHVTDVTNASYTMLMDLKTLEWSRSLCSFFNVPQEILPTIKSCAEIYGPVYEGALRGVPVASCMGDQPAALLGEMCIHPTQCVCMIENGCFLLVNTGQEVIDSDNGLLSTVGYKLGPKAKPYYVLEGAVANAGSAITWLKEKLLLDTDSQEVNSLSGVLNSVICDSGLSSKHVNENCDSSNDKSGIVFIPAFNGLYSPLWKHDARGVILGVDSQTRKEHIVKAAYEATCFQIRDILESIKKDTPTWNQTSRLIVGGEFSENDTLMQRVADICGIEIERPQTTSASCLGTMLSAGIAMGVLNLEGSTLSYKPPSDLFGPLTNNNRRDVLYKRWKYAIKKCLAWDNYESFDENVEAFNYDEKDPDLAVYCSIPGGIYITSSFALLLLAKFLQN